MISRDELELTQFQAGKLSKSGLLPNTLDTEEKVFAVMTFGQELGLKAWQSINGIQVIQGRPTASPQLMLGLIERSGKLEDIQITVTETEATVMMKRKKRSPHVETFSLEDAKRMITTEYLYDPSAGKKMPKRIPLSEKYNWKTMPKVMLKWRAVAACARVVFADIICGLYLHEEIDPNLQVSEEGEIIQAEVVEKTSLKEVSQHSAKTASKAKEIEEKETEKSTENDTILEPKQCQNSTEKAPKNDQKQVENSTENGTILEPKQSQNSTENGAKTEQNLPQKSTEKGTENDGKTEPKTTQKSTKNKPEIVIPENAIPEVSWNAPWIALTQKGYTKEEAKKVLRNLYSKFLMPDGTPKASTKQLIQKELDWVLSTINAMQDHLPEFKSDKAKLFEKTLTKAVSKFKKGKEWLEVSLKAQKITYESMTQEQYQEFEKLIKELDSKTIEADLSVLNTPPKDTGGITKLSDALKETPNIQSEIERAKKRLEKFGDMELVSDADLRALLLLAESVKDKNRISELELLLEKDLTLMKAEFFDMLDSLQSGKSN